MIYRPKKLKLFLYLSFCYNYSCLQCDSIFPTRQALDEHREQMDHYDYATNNYGSDTTSFGSAAVDDNDHNNGITIIQEEEENLLL